MTVRIAQADDLDTCLALRRQVFIEEQGVSEAEEIDGLDGTALHLMAVDGATPVGTARILIEGDTAKIGRVCVLRTARGTGLGAQLIEAALGLARAQYGVTRAVLGAQVQALGFYEKLGFAAFGPVYDDAGIDHRDMERIL
ncbi:GNAT family N-acetyltransferase [Roseobacter sp. MH60115]|uniref:GNAT family N-acetyltransferase n=1 Tax=Roseobacter sp. MH60115 TaxID=2785324 RepID=UPI0018A2AD84|nr:GNAT family N-acetyltransferase [Roseobacter sp. MH60115]